MSLRNVEQKFTKESEASVKVKAELAKHDATFRAVMAAFEAGVPEVERIAGEIVKVREAGGSPQRLSGLNEELRKAKQLRDAPFQNYKSIQGDLRRELEALVKPFIQESADTWESETTKIKAEIVHQEIPPPKEEPGVFGIGGPHKILTNRKAVSSFREMSLENLGKLRSMTCNSIPEIEAFILEAEVSMRSINLIPVVIEQDERTFQQDSQDSVREPGKMGSGFVSPYGKDGVEIKPASADPVDSLEKRFDSARAKFKHVLPMP